MDKHTQWQSCYGANNLDQTPVNNCYNNGLGFQVSLHASLLWETKLYSIFYPNNGSIMLLVFYTIQLEMAYADETTKLNPRHRFVPWVVVNNIPLQEVSLSHSLYT